MLKLEGESRIGNQFWLYRIQYGCQYALGTRKIYQVCFVEFYLG